MDERKALKKKQTRRLILTLAALTLLLVFSMGIYNRAIVGIVEKDMGEILLKASNRGQFMMQENVANGFSKLHQMAEQMSQSDLTDETILTKPEYISGENSWYAITDLNGATISSQAGFPQTAGVKILEQGLGQDEALVTFQTIDPTFTSLGIVFLVPIKNNGIVKGILSLFYDISTMSAVMESTIEGGRIASYLITKEGQGVIWNQKGENPLGFSMDGSFANEEFLEKNPVIKALKVAMENQDHGIIRSQNKDGNLVYLSYSATGIQDWYFVNMAQTDLISQKSAEVSRLVWLLGGVIILVVLALVCLVVIFYHQKGSNMEQEVLFDKLTGISNWKNLESMVKNLPFDKGEYACLVFNIRNFRRVNALFGFEEGGKMLRAIAQTLESSIGEGEHACRVSGDNFAVLLHFTHQAALTMRIDGLFAKLELLDVQENRSTFNYKCTYRGGVCLMKELSEDQGVVDARDRAIMVLENQPKMPVSKWGYFDEEAKQELQLRQELEGDIVRAFNEKEFVPYFQPQYHTATGQIFGAEVLARWNHPQRGIIMPRHFIPVLERAGCILDLDMSMMEGACHCLKSWIDQGLLPMTITVNVSRLNLHRKDFIKKVKMLVDTYRVPPNLLAFEIDEKALTEDIDKIQEVIEALRTYGIQIIMDDSGAGKTSIEVFQRITLDFIKVNKAFFLSGKKGDRETQVLLNIMSMTNGLGTTVIAKYVETMEEMEYIQSFGCENMQGRLFAEPMGEEAFRKFVI